MLIQLPDILSADDIAHAQSLLQNAPWDDGRLSAGSQAVQVKNNQQLPHDCEAATQIRQMVLRGLDASALFFSAALPKRIFTPRINRYNTEHNTYGDHYDNAIRLLPDGQRVRTDLSCTVFLNDPDSYDGGELIVHHAFGVERVKLPAGHAVLYPGTSLHQVSPVTRGERLACFFWLESLIRSETQRTLLFEMDMALTSLRSQHGDGAETTALTGVYHNLLRLWADT